MGLTRLEVLGIVAVEVVDIMTYSKELMGASTALLILSVLAKEASYGYEIIKRINAEADGMFTWQEGTVYPVLHKLEKEGKVRAQWQQSDTGRNRKYYYITANGRKTLEKGTGEWNVFHTMLLNLGEAHHG
jgi:DNA-binding PadR family transcriptional regulator